MAKTLQFRRDTTGNLASITGALGEIFIDTTKDTVVVMDGSTAGGFPLQGELTAGSGIDITAGTISATGGGVAAFNLVSVSASTYTSDGDFTGFFVGQSGDNPATTLQVDSGEWTIPTIVTGTISQWPVGTAFSVVISGTTYNGVSTELWTFIGGDNPSFRLSNVSWQGTAPNASGGWLNATSLTFGGSFTTTSIKTDNYFYANGAAVSFGGSSYGNTDVASYLTSYTGNIGNVKTTANVVTSSYFIGNGSQLTGIVSSYGNTDVASYLTSYTGNIGNVKTTANVVTSGYFIGNGSQLTGITSSYTLPTASTTVKGGVIVPAVDASGLTNTSGTIGIATATKTQVGGIFGLVDSRIALGSNAGQTNQYDSTIAIGVLAGGGSQNIYAVAIGTTAGRTAQGESAVAIGTNAAYTSQGNDAVAIGNVAGKTYQGISSIAIGKGAGKTDQPNYSIVLNASGTDMVMTGNAASAFYVNPVRNAVTSQSVYYDTTTKEISYGNSSIAGVGVTITSPSAGQVISYGTALGPVENTYTNYTTQYPAIEELPGAVNYSITNDVSDSNNLLLAGTFPESFYSKFTVGQQFKYKLTYWSEDIYEVTSVTTTDSTTIEVGVTWIGGGSNMMASNLAENYSSYFKFTTNQSVPQWINANAASSYNQSLNTTSSVVFNALQVTGALSLYVEPPALTLTTETISGGMGQFRIDSNGKFDFPTPDPTPPFDTNKFVTGTKVTLTDPNYGTFVIELTQDLYLGPQRYQAQFTMISGGVVSPEAYASSVVIEYTVNSSPAPINKTTVVKWAPIVVGGQTYFTPLYQ